MGGSREPSPRRSRSRSRDRSPKRKQGGSRSRSRSHHSARGNDRRKRADDYGVDSMKITDDDAAFILGKGGKTKDKIARVAGAELELYERDLVLEIRGSKSERRKARKYAEGIMAQRVGPVSVGKDCDDGDLTTLYVPQETVGFVTGRAGNFLRTIEEEWTTLMFFCDVGAGARRDKDFEKLAIYGSIRGRRGAELKVLSAVETKNPGYFNKIKDEVMNRDRGEDEDGTWGTDKMEFQDDELSYALGKQGATRKKLEVSSGAIVQYIGHTALFSGTREQRKRAREYMKWLFMQLEGPVYVDGWQDRDDCCVLDIPSGCVGYVTGNRRATLSRLEDDWGVLMFFMSRGKGSGRIEKEQLIIFGPRRGRRGAELDIMSTVENKHPGVFTRGQRDKTSEHNDFDTDRLTFKDDELGYALGKEGSTRKKLEAAAGCILQFVGNFAFIAGEKKERKRCREYIGWLLAQRRGMVTISDTARRDDVTEMHVPSNCVGWVTGNRGSELRRMEQETSTFMFMALNERGEERLMIFSHEAGSKVNEKGRMAGERLVNEMIQDKMKGDDRGRSDSRGRSPPRRRSPSRRRRSDSRRRRSPSRKRRDSRSRSRR